jgi:tetratricopeptide (TPR) repeat protein
MPWKCVLGIAVAATMGCANVPKTMPRVLAKSERAERKAELVCEYERRRDQSQYQAAVSKAQQGDTPGARQTLDLLLERSPSHRPAILLASEIELELHRPQRALELLQPLLKSNANDADAHHLFGLAEEVLGRKDRAKHHFAEAVRLSPGNEVFRASLELTDGNEPLSSRQPEQPHPIELAGYYEQTGPTAASEPRDLLAAGHQALAAGNLELASRNYLAAMSSAPEDPKIPCDAAIQLLQHNQTDAAVDLLRHACHQFPQSVALLRTLATAQYRRGDYESSQVALQQALSLDNNDALAYFLMGAVSEKLGDHEGAARSISRARQLDSTLSARR